MGEIYIVDSGLEKGLQRLKRLWEQNVYRDFKRHEFFLSPGERRRTKIREGIRRAKKRERKILESERHRQDRSTGLQNVFRGVENIKGR